MIALIRKRSTKGYKPEIEISGGVNLKTARKFERLDADRISIGMITHSSSALDVTLAPHNKMNIIEILSTKECISGSEIGRFLGISRAAVRNQSTD